MPEKPVQDGEPGAENAKKASDSESKAEEVPLTPEQKIEQLNHELKLEKTKTQQLMKQIEDLQASNDRLLRAIAEYDNLRRRAEKDAANEKALSIKKFAEGLLDVADNLARAKTIAKDLSHPEVKSVVEGIAMTEANMMKTFEENGLKKIDPLGEKFDPAFHNALFQVE